MEGLLKLSVQKYLDIIGKDAKLKKVSTPSLPEETKSSPYRAPSDGKRKVECPWRAHSFDPEMPVLHETGSSRPGQDSESLNRGNLAPHAASVLMKLLYAARIARFDLLRSINALARNVTKWTQDDDARLHHLMCYVNSTLSLKMIGWVGDKIEDLSYLQMRISLGVLNPYDQLQDRTYKSKVSSQDSHLLVEVSDKGVLVIQPPKLKLWLQILHLGL